MHHKQFTAHSVKSERGHHDHHDELDALKAKLDAMLVREGRDRLAKACFDFLPARASLDLAGWEDVDIFAHA